MGGGSTSGWAGFDLQAGEMSNNKTNMLRKEYLTLCSFQDQESVGRVRWKSALGRIKVNWVDVCSSRSGIKVNVDETMIVASGCHSTEHEMCVSTGHIVASIVSHHRVISRCQACDLIVLLVLERIYPRVGSIGRVEGYHTQRRDEFTWITKLTRNYP